MHKSLIIRREDMLYLCYVTVTIDFSRHSRLNPYLVKRRKHQIKVLD